MPCLGAVATARWSELSSGAAAWQTTDKTSSTRPQHGPNSGPWRVRRCRTGCRASGALESGDRSLFAATPALERLRMTRARSRAVPPRVRSGSSVGRAREPGQGRAPGRGAEPDGGEDARGHTAASGDQHRGAEPVTRARSGAGRLSPVMPASDGSTATATRPPRRATSLFTAEASPARAVGQRAERGRGQRRHGRGEPEAEHDDAGEHAGRRSRRPSPRGRAARARARSRVAPRSSGAEDRCERRADPIVPTARA